MPHSCHSVYKTLVLLTSLLLLSACASVPGGPTKGDPLESYNRAMFSFNEGLDKHLIKPVTKGYDKVVPDPVKTGVTNFFSNIDDVFVIINDLLQFKITQAIQDTSRFFFNSTIGLFGLIDVATPMGIQKNNEDLGQTLGAWGVPKGPYFVLPVFGPRTMRGVGGFVVESYYDPVYNIEDVVSLYSTVILRTIDSRYKLLYTSRVIDQAAVDKYSFVRDAYIQRRENLVHDGNPPTKKAEPLPKSTKEDEDLENLLEKELGL